MMNRTRRAQRRISMVAAALCLLLGGGALYAAAAPTEGDAGRGSRDGEPLRTVVILVRHTEKGTDDPNDPSLTPAGVKRAEDLARMLSEAGVTHLFASEYRRARNTLTPLASRLDLEVREVPAGNPEEQVAAIRGLPAGSVAVVAGHSNTVPNLVRLLGGKVSGLVDTGHGPMIDDDAHDRMFLLILPPGGSVGTIERAQTVELRYGD